MSRPVVVLGGGGHARVVVDLAEALGREILGFVAPEDPPAGLLGYDRLGGDDIVSELDPAIVTLANGVGSPSGQPARQVLYDRWRGAGFEFDTLVHPSAVVSSKAELGAGCQVMAGAVVQVGTRTGANVIINTRASVDHDCVLGENCHIAPGATLSGAVEVGEGAHVGAGATVLQGVRIGRRAVVAAGAVVIRDVGDGATVMGIPARDVS